MKKRLKVLSVILSFVLFIVHINAITSQAAPLGAADAAAVSNAILRTQQQSISPRKDYFATLEDGSTRFVKSLAITNLEKPVHGKLLDESATVITDSGFSWDIPVIWTNKEGDIIHLAIEIDDLVNSYPVFVFYMPEGYALLLGEKTGYDIQMPDFVVDLMKVNGVTTLSIPENGLTYISAVLPERNGMSNNADTEKETEVRPDSDTEETQDSDKSDDERNDSDTGSSEDSRSDDRDQSDPDRQETVDTPVSEPVMTKPTDNDRTPPDTGLSDEENQKLVEAHCDQNVIEKIGADKLAALVNWVKTTLEPETVSLLTSKFPAFQKATEKGELGKNIGLYVYYNTYYDEDGKAHDKSRSLASVDTVSDSSGKVKYRLSVNAGGFYEQDPETGDYEFNKSDAYSDLDNTLVHEMMHAFMYDYTRTGMTGWEYDKSDGAYDLAAEDELRFPKWFSEGVASTVENTFQYWKDEFYQYFNNGKESSFSEGTMKKSYKNNPEYNLNGSDVESDYITGYLACLYLSYLNAKQDNKEAITGSIENGDLRVDSDVLREGLNGILEDLHRGKNLDQIIAGVSKVDGKSMYKDTQDFESKFIIGDTTDRASLQFCSSLLNYMHSSSFDKETANGSILLDLADTNTTQLNKSQLKNKQKAYTVTDDSDFATSTVNKKSALKSGGTSGDGIVGTSDSEQLSKISNEKTDQSVTDEAAKINNRSDDSSAKEAQNTNNESSDAVKEVKKETLETTEKDADKLSESNQEKTSKENSEEASEKVLEEKAEEDSEKALEEKNEEISDESLKEKLTEASGETEEAVSEETGVIRQNAEDTDAAAQDTTAEALDGDENIISDSEENTESALNTDQQNAETKAASGEETTEAAEQSASDAADESAESNAEEAGKESQEAAGEDVSEASQEETQEVSGEAVQKTAQEDTAKASQEENHEEAAETSQEAAGYDENEDSQRETREVNEEVNEEPQAETHEEVNEEAQEESHQESGEEVQEEAQQETHEDTDESSSDTENTEDSSQESDDSSETEESYESPVIISETPEESEESSDDDLSEQVLDAMAEDNSSEDD